MLAVPAIAVPFDDAGSGMDAGDSPDDALTLPVSGTYMGAVDLPGDEDWYELPALTPPTPVCVQGITQGVDANLRLNPRTDGIGPTVEAPFSADNAAGIGIARLALGETLLGIVGPASSMVGAYSFSIHHLSVAELGPGDGGSGRDAGHTPSTAVPVNGPCIGGTLGSKDHLDAYSFAGANGDNVVFSFAAVAKNTGLPTASYLTLVRPDLTLAKTIYNGDIASFTLDQDGTWYYAASSPNTSNGIDYGFGTCHPYCLLIS